MDAATGPPDAMRDRREDLTPMMDQYFALCEAHADSLVLFQVGDFYETFCGAAETVSRLLDVTLTAREDSTGEYPMAGIPVDNAESYVSTLLDAGYRVAVADQVEDPEEATGVVDRAVTRVITPGTLTEDELVDPETNNYVASLAGDGPYGLALLDVSTGELLVTGGDEMATVADEVERFAPSEAIVAPESPDDPFAADCMVTPYESSAFEADRARDRVADQFGVADAALESDAEFRACGALVDYAEYTRGGEDGTLVHLNRLARYDPREYMVLDAVALRSLEVLDRRTVHGDDDHTLADVLDQTSSALGCRKLKSWLRRPLIDRGDIEGRLDAVEELSASVRTRETVRDHLRDVYDVERLVTRVSRGAANARDLLALRDTLAVVPEVKAAVADAETDRLRECRDGLDELADVRELIDRAIREDPPPEITEGGIIKPGFDDELDDLRHTEREGKEWIDSLEATERERTGIESLKVGVNDVHGYYIEVTDPNLDRVPDDYTRRQTLKNAERFYTPELKDREDEIFRAENRADRLEHRLFREVRDDVAAEAERLQGLADALATLDAFVSLAEVAVKRDYVRPTFDGDGIDVAAGRHPVVERVQPSFVPNDAALDPGAVAIVTGPNMSGKSTYMRQVALIAVLAQIGSFVPADRANLDVVDRVFTRVGASDDIAGGRSTFMIEMTELAEILDHATDRSLVLLDEVGRGTSTTDGLAIARAVVEHLHDDVGAYTLFATHHHDLTGVADDLDRVRNLHLDATRVGGEVVFDHEVAPGASSSSYGVDVAQLAGVPESVVRRSRELLDEATGDERVDGPPSRDVRANGDARANGASGEADADPDPDPDPDVDPDALAELRDVNLADTTPVEALCLLNRLKRDQN